MLVRAMRVLLGVRWGSSLPKPFQSFVFFSVFTAFCTLLMTPVCLARNPLLPSEKAHDSWTVRPIRNVGRFVVRVENLDPFFSAQSGQKMELVRVKTGAKDSVLEAFITNPLTSGRLPFL